MKATLGQFLLTLGIVGLLGLPVVVYSADGAQTTGRDLGAKAHLLAAGGSLVVTGNEAPAAPETSPTEAPELAVATPLFDFGRVLDGTEVAHEFLIENRGRGDLAIEKVLTG